jgi:hypothetical protein
MGAVSVMYREYLCIRIKPNGAPGNVAIRRERGGIIQVRYNPNRIKQAEGEAVRSGLQGEVSNVITTLSSSAQFIYLHQRISSGRAQQFRRSILAH